MPRGAARAIGYDVGVSASRDDVHPVAFAERKHDFESEHHPRSVFLTLTSRHRVTGSMLSVALPQGTTCELLECALEGYGATDDSARRTAHGVFSPHLFSGGGTHRFAKLRVESHFAASRKAGGWTLTTLCLDRPEGDESGGDDSPRICLNLMEEAHYGTLRNVAPPSRSFGAEKKPREETPAPEAQERSDETDVTRAESEPTSMLFDSTNHDNTPKTVVKRCRGSRCEERVAGLDDENDAR
jgi:hypothetical protein